jgi:hypothetical protein
VTDPPIGIGKIFIWLRTQAIANVMPASASIQVLTFFKTTPPFQNQHMLARKKNRHAHQEEKQYPRIRKNKKPL